MRRKPTFRELAEGVGLRQADIIRMSELSGPTIRKLWLGEPVSRHSLRAALFAINERLGITYNPEHVDAPIIER